MGKPNDNEVKEYSFKTTSGEYILRLSHKTSQKVMRECSIFMKEIKPRVFGHEI